MRQLRLACRMCLCAPDGRRDCVRQKRWLVGWIFDFMRRAAPPWAPNRLTRASAPTRLSGMRGHRLAPPGARKRLRSAPLRAGGRFAATAHPQSVRLPCTFRRGACLAGQARLRSNRCVTPPRTRLAAVALASWQCRPVAGTVSETLVWVRRLKHKLVQQPTPVYVSMSFR